MRWAKATLWRKGMTIERVINQAASKPRITAATPMAASSSMAWRLPAAMRCSSPTFAASARASTARARSTIAVSVVRLCSRTCW
ncbi:hypothetical protein D3C72_1544720 [compost metagenome]